MHRQLIRWLRPQGRDEQGAVAIIVAASLTLLLVVAAMVLDFGLVRIDRQVDKSAADSATLAGLHALNTGDGNPHPYAGVCTAVRYLKVNSDRFSGINENTGWKNGLGASTGNGCSDVTLRNKTCIPTNKATWAKFQWTGTSGGVTLDVTIESGYSFTGSTWPEDSLPASSPDTGVASQQGCDHLAVTVSQSRKPGLGSLATDSDLVTRIRSVGRVKPVPGRSAPALLLLKQTGCPALLTGSNSGTSYIHVFGALTSNGLSQPGTIHSDSDGTPCTGGSNQNILNGRASEGIVAYAAPLVSSPTSPDPAKPGQITSVAAANGAASGIVRDSLNNVYGSAALTGTTGTKGEVTGRSLITRRLVDERYFVGVKGAVAGASTVFASGASGPIPSWKKFPPSVDPCKPTPAQVSALTLAVADRLYIDCTGKFVGDSAGLTINAGTVYFRGWVNPSSTLKLPNAHHVYLGNHGDNASAIDIGGSGSSFEVNTAGNMTTSAPPICASGQKASKAVLFVRSGLVKETSGLVRLCRTTAIMMGGSATGCVPAFGNEGSAPTATPCPGINSGRGNGQWFQTGGGIDWTAPDTIDVTLDPAGAALPAAKLAWESIDGPEDLALWSESGTSSSDKYSMAGGGTFNVRGVFMIPNATPFTMSGNTVMDLTNAQYITTNIELSGADTKVNMRVDPNSAVTLPDLGLVGLVR